MTGTPEGPQPREEREEGSDRPPITRVADWGLAFDLGLRLGLAIVIGLVLGLLVDGWLHTSPVFTLIGLVLGVAAAFYTIWDVAKRSMNR